MTSLLPTGGGNPVALDDDALLSRTPFDIPLRETQTTHRYTDSQGNQITETWDRTDTPIVQVVEHANVDITTATYFNDIGVAAVELDYDSDTRDLIGGRALENGRVVEEFANHSDGSYTVTRYDSDGNVTHEQTYDKDGKPIDADGNPTQDALGGEFGDTDECRALTLMLLEDRAEVELARLGIRPEVSNPNPEAETVPAAGEEDCLQLGGGIPAAHSLGCNNAVVHCLQGELVDAQCNCVQQNLGLPPDRGCELAMLCADGSAPVRVDGQCRCEGDEGSAFVDPTFGDPTGPDPVDRSRPRR